GIKESISTLWGACVAPATQVNLLERPRTRPAIKNRQIRRFFIFGGFLLPVKSLFQWLNR
ncbi:TPA: hypothetical protein ACHLG1_004395, partial [Escherichia coli]